MAKSLEEKVAIVTGGNSGIGAGIVALFLEHGAKVAVLDVLEPSSDVNSDARLDIQCNVASEDAVKGTVQQVVDKLGTVDILVNCAGVQDNFERADAMPTAIWDRVMGVNLNGPFYLMRACIPYFLAKPTSEPTTTDTPSLRAGTAAVPAATKSRGVIINVCSIAAIRGAASGAAYTASKHALLGLSRHTSWSYRNDGIRCNVVMPGAVMTDIMKNSKATPDPVGFQALGPFHACAPGMLLPADIANAVLFLAATEGVNGAELTVDKGWTMA